MDHVKEVSLGDEHSAAITEDGDLYVWGRNYEGQLGDGTNVDSDTPVKIMEHVREVSLGGLRSAAITEDGELYLWGSNMGGQLGNGTYEDSNVPVRIMSHVRDVSLGTNHSAAITEDGDLYLWGSNGVGQLGNETNEGSNVPVRIMSHVKAVSLGAEHSAVITEDGDLYLWGWNYYGQLGNGTTQDSNTPIKITLPSVISTASAFSLSSQDAAEEMNLSNIEVMDTEKAESVAVVVDEAEVIPAAVFSVGQQTWNGTSFTGLIPDETYNYYVMKDRTADKPFSADNLLYIGQSVSDGSGALSAAFAMKDTYSNADIFAVPMHLMDLSGAAVTVSDLTYSGEEQYAAVTVSCDGVTLVEGVDYYVGGDYGVTQEGSYSLTVKGTGLYTGTVSADYRVLPKVKTAAITGTVDSFGAASAETTIRLLDNKGTVIAEKRVTGCHAAYEFKDVPKGSYILRVDRPGHVVRDYSVTVGNQDAELDMEIWRIGDVNGDGRINAIDKRMIYNHIAAHALEGYRFAVGDINCDGKINAMDKRMLYNHMAGMAPLW